MSGKLLLAIGISVTLMPLACDADEDKSRRAVMPGKHAELFQNHCFDCHDSAGAEAGVDLESIPYEVSANVENAALWQKVLNAINSGEMPPEDSEPLPDNLKLRFLEDLTEQMVAARKILGDNGGVTPLRRLNRREYANTIESLLGVRPDVSSLPDDQVGSGFDTQGASLFMSSDQIEQYLNSARAALQLCFDTPVNSKPETVRIEPEEEYTEHYRAYLKSLVTNAKKSREFLAQSEKPSSAFGILDPHQADVYLQHDENWRPQLEQYLSWPETKNGISLIMTIKAGGMTRVRIPAVRKPGRYKIRVRAGMYPDAAERFHYLEFSATENRSRKHLGWRKVTASLDQPQVIEFPIESRPGEVLNLQVHQRSHQDRGDKALWSRAQKANGVGLPPGIWIDWVELVGPEPTGNWAEQKTRLLPGRRAGQSEKSYVRQTILDFATRAFRGKVPSDAYLQKLWAQFLQERESGSKLEQALIEPLAIILASPEFLYMVNDGLPDDPKMLSPTELAVRLSYTLWSSPPDAELTKLADSGALSNPDVLREQSLRLLRDERCDRFVREFTHQWLQMDRLGMFQFNGLLFPTFDNAVRESAREEIFQMVELVLREGRPMGELLDADYVVINDLLAGYYGIEGVQGSEFREVKVGKGSVRGGLLGTAAVAAMGSDGLRSSPVERGAWVLRHLLHDPPAPAPPNVPQLSRLEGKPRSSRELQRLHQEQPQCAQCHRKLDPIGYGLENFAADGQWREKESIVTGKVKEVEPHKVVSFEIDPSGKLPNGESFRNFHELRRLIGSQDAAFARGFVEDLIAYGKGRPYGFTDEPLADAIMAQAGENDFVMEEMILAFLQSKTFQTK